MLRLVDFRRNIYSQNGEDGVIAEIFRRLPASVPRWYTEFGAWDGRFGSNCYALALEGWQGVMIEGDTTRFGRLERTARRFAGRMVAVSAFVESGKHLEQILESANVPRDFGLLSIDIDSFDFDILKGMDQYRPAVIIIEIDSSIPPGILQVWDGVTKRTTSFTSMVELGISKGYLPVCHTGNVIFVRNDLVEYLGESIPEPDDLFIRDWINPTRMQVFRRKLRGFTPQRALGKAEDVFANLTQRG